MTTMSNPAELGGTFERLVDGLRRPGPRRATTPQRPRTATRRGPVASPRHRVRRSASRPDGVRGPRLAAAALHSAQATPRSAQATPRSRQRQATLRSAQATPRSRQATPRSAQATPRSAQATLRSAQRHAVRSGSVTAAPGWQLTDRGLAVVMVLGAMLMLAAAVAVVSTAIEVTSPDYRPDAGVHRLR